MKKFLLLSALFIGALSMNAQTITVTVDGENVENGATINSYNQFREMFGPDSEFGVMLQPEAMVSVSQDATVSATLYDITQGTDYPGVAICFGGNCEPATPDNPITKTQQLAANTPTDLQIESGLDYEKTPFSASCRIVITAGTSNFTFNLNMIYDPNYDAGVEGIEADDEAPVYYNLNGVKVANPEKGIYIKKQGSKVSKVAL